MKIFLRGKSNIYLEIVEQYRKYILLGIIKNGERLPSCRILASDLGINPNTVEKAYSALEKEGYIKTLPKKGVYVCYGEGNKELIHAKELINDIHKSNITKEELLKIIDEIYEGDDKND